MIAVNFLPCSPYMYPRAYESDNFMPSAEEDIIKKCYEIACSYDDIEWDLYVNDWHHENELSEVFDFCYIIWGTDSIKVIDDILSKAGAITAADFENDLFDSGFSFVRLGRDYSVRLGRDYSLSQEGTDSSVLKLAGEYKSKLDRSEVMDFHSHIDSLKMYFPTLEEELDKLGFDWARAKSLSKRARMLERD